MKKLAIAALACVLVGGFCFSACTIERIDPEADNNTAATNTGKRVLNVCNWGEYMWQGGLKEGLEQGLEQGINQGEEKLNSLYVFLMNDGKLEEMKRVMHDKAYRQELYKVYGL